MYFIDIVGSTALATELGDARWKELLTRFRRVVRGELKRYGGREQDTTGDGFFATFTEPAQALRASVEIAGAVQELGVDIRTGIHTGEIEEIDGKVGGIAVHVAARVMGLAGAAEVFVTSTVRDLVSGSDATFEDRGLHELKGVEDARHVFALTAIVTRLPQPLSQQEAAERLSHVVPSRVSRRARMVLGAAVAVVVAAAVVGGVLAFSGGATAQPAQLLRLDAGTQKITATIPGSSGSPNHRLWFNDGTLWQMQGHANASLVARDPATGATRVSVPLGANACSCQVAFGFGSVWLAKRTLDVHTGSGAWTVQRIDPLSGKVLKTFQLPTSGDFSSIATGDGAAWVMLTDATLVRIDPNTNRIVRTYKTGAVETSILNVVGKYVWVCECVVNKVLRFDPETGKPRTFTIAENAVMVPVAASKVTLFDGKNGTVTVMDPQTGHEDPPVGLAGNPQDAAVLDGVAWVAAGAVVDRVDLSSGSKSQIQMPKGVKAAGIAADPASHSLWISNGSA
jgi:streptogramin lyase